MKTAENSRIAIVGSYPPPYGGVSTTVMQLAVHLKHEGYNVRVFADNMEQEDHKNHVYYFSPREKRLSQNLLFKLREFDPHIIHSHTSTLKTSTALFSKILGIPLIHQIYGERFPLQYETYSARQKWQVKWAAHQARMLIPASQELADFFLKLEISRSQIQVIPCLLPLESIEIEEENAYLNGISEDQLVLTTTGYFPFQNKHYGFDLIPIVAKSLREKQINFIWFLIGQGSEAEIHNYRRKLISAGVENCVVFLGELERPNILSLLQHTHIYVRTKHSDSFGIVIAEAHQLACHCLIGDNNPYFKEGNRITKYVTGDADSLTQQLLKILTRIAPNKTRDSNSQFAIEARRNYEHIKQIYAEILANE